MADLARGQLRPTTADALAECLREASARGQAIIPWGAGTLQHLGNRPPDAAVIVRTTALDRVTDYTPADLTITVEAGATLGAIQALLGRQGQWLPWQPAVPDTATLGGLLAAGASGPLRLGYGTPRDWVLGMRVALGDGRLVKSGSKVVKNVAGYDLHKLHIGALGTLGVIVEATFKIAPLPERSGSLVLVCPQRVAALTLAEQLRTPPLAPVSLSLVEQSTGALASALPGDPAHPRLVVRFDGVAAAVERQLHAAVALAERGNALPIWLSEQQGQAIWQALVSFPAPPSAATGAPYMLLRAGAPASELLTTLTALERHAPPADTPAQLVGYAGVGLAYARWPLPAAAPVTTITAALAALRATLAQHGGYVVVEAAPAALRQHLDVWGTPETLALMRALKAQWDPRGVLNAGRYAGGL
jgi:glycolate oxidase FAD binding subunit